MEITAVKTSLFRLGADLSPFLLEFLPPLKEGEVIVVTSKIVALAEGRVGRLVDRVKLIKNNSQALIKTPWAWLTLTADGWCLNAGIDESNADGQLVLLPKRPHQAAKKIRAFLIKHYRLKNLGVIITDTKSVPLRAGTIGRALGYAGFLPLRDYIGQKDLFGRKTRRTQSNVADALAAAAVLMMGEGAEQTPLTLIRGAPVSFKSGRLSSKLTPQLSLPPTKDVYSKVFQVGAPGSRGRSKKRHL